MMTDLERNDIRYGSTEEPREIRPLLDAMMTGLLNAGVLKDEPATCWKARAALSLALAQNVATCPA